MTYDLERIRALFAECDDQGALNAVRGKALESLVVELFGAIPGVRVEATNSLDVFGAQEIDVGIWNEGHPEGLQGLAQIFLVECKNWNRPVGSLEVAWFDTKLRLRGLSFGVLVAMNGITGNHHSRISAHLILSAALHEKRSLVVLTRGDLESLRRPPDLVEMLKRKLMQLTLSAEM